MKICYLVPHLSTGGMPQFLYKRIESLCEYTDIEPYVVELTTAEGDKYVVQKNRILSKLKPDHMKVFNKDDDTLMDFFDFIESEHIDIVHIDETIEVLLLTGVITDDFIKKLTSDDRHYKIVETSHNSFFDANEDLKYIPDAFAFCNKLHPDTLFSKYKDTVFNKSIEYPIENLVPDTYNKKICKRITGLYANINVTTIGVFASYKCLNEFIDIAKYFKEKDKTDYMFNIITVLGDNFKDVWLPIVNNLPSNVRVLTDREDINNILDATDIFVHLSNTEAVAPIVSKEAISHKLPLVIKKIDAYGDFFDDYDVTYINSDDTIEERSNKIIDSLHKNDYKVVDGLQKFGRDYYDFYNDVMKLNQQDNDDVKIEINGINGGNINISGGDESVKYKVLITDEYNNIEYLNIIKTNINISLYKKYYVAWKFKVYKMLTDDEDGECELIFDEQLNLDGRRVLIAFESDALGDTIAWMPYMEEFRKKHNCTLIVSTHINSLFDGCYTGITFIEPGALVEDIYAVYTIGLYFNDLNDPEKEKQNLDKTNGVIDFNKTPLDFKYYPLMCVASQILGMDYKEVRAKIAHNDLPKRKRVGLGIMSSAQEKFWNYIGGWDVVTDYLVSIGYEVVVYSKEPDGFMNNHYPKNATHLAFKTMSELSDSISTCEFFIGVSSGLTWLAWGLGIHIILISGFTYPYNEMTIDTQRIYNRKVCNGCWHRYRFNRNVWDWCPDHFDDDRRYECTAKISPEQVIEAIDEYIGE